MGQPSFLARRDALSQAVFIARTPDRAKYLKRKKLPENSLPVIYADALKPFLADNCIAAAEDKADAEVSKRFGWPTLRSLRGGSDVVS